MENVSQKEQMESTESFESTIRKSEKALAQMIGKGANTTLVKKRLNALRIGLAVLENTWYQKPYSYTLEELAEARNVLSGLFPSLEDMLVKSKEGSPQKTLLKRRIRSLELAVEVIDDLSKSS